MVNPINGDKPLSTTTTRSDASSRGKEATPVSGQTDSSSQKQSAQSVGSSVDIDKGRQLYEMESQRSAATGQPIETPEQARSLLGQILNQISQAPEQAMKSQASATASPLANLLESAPA
jgi:hypothetical protein